jgi:signal peptidase II
MNPGSLFESRRKLFWLFAGLALALDQLTKLWLWRPEGSPDRPLVLIPRVLELVSHPGNVRGAFGLGPSAPLFFIIPAVLGLVVMVYFLLSTSAGNGLIASALGLLAGGDVGNLADRLALRHVRDFIDLHWGAHHWPTFNVADSAICIGFAIIVVDLLFSKDRAAEDGQDGPALHDEGPDAALKDHPA